MFRALALRSDDSLHVYSYNLQVTSKHGKNIGRITHYKYNACLCSYLICMSCVCYQSMHAWLNGIW